MMYWFMSRCHNKDILNNVIFAFKMALLSERHLMTVVTNMPYSRHMSCHGYEGVMSVCTPLQVKCYQKKLDLNLLKHSYNIIDTLIATSHFYKMYKNKLADFATTM